MDSKSKGELAEMIFQVEATKREIIVAKPFGDNQPYDFITECKGVLKRVQVKATWTSKKKRETHRDSYRIQVNRGFNKRGYEYDSFDLLACYVAPWDTWYILDKDFFTNKTSVYIHEEFYTGQGRWDRFYEL